MSSKTRGKACGKKLEKELKDNGGNPLPVKWNGKDPDVPINSHYKMITREIGIWIRAHAPVYYNTLSSTEDKVNQVKEKLLNHLKVYEYIIILFMVTKISVILFTTTCT